MDESLPRRPEVESEITTTDCNKLPQHRLDYQIVVATALRLSAERKADRMKRLTLTQTKNRYNPIQRAIRNRSTSNEQ